MPERTSPNSFPVVRTADVSDLPAVTTLLADAFLDDPVMSWAFPHAQRHARLRTVFGFVAEHVYLPSGHSALACTADGEAIGTTLWRHEDGTDDNSFWEDHGAEFVAALEGDVERLSAFSAVMAEHHPSDPHRYLLAIGTDPTHQSRGVGSALGAFMLDQLRADGVNGYLEATSPRSRALYLRWGFEVISEFSPPDGPPIWGMWFEAT